MVINFANLNCKARPTLVLRSLDGTAIQTLGYAFDISLEAMYREISTLTFSIPAHVEGKRVPGYEKVTGMRMVELVGIGRFIITSSGITETATKELKTVKAQSLEFELTFKKLSLTRGTYRLWSNVVSDQPKTILGIILDEIPAWGKTDSGYSVEVDESLMTRYRTFECEAQNLFNFVKGTLEDSFQCIFEFDTMNRRIRVRDVASTAVTQPVYISLNNLAKEITIDEDSENIYTCLDVNGADGVNIRDVNPMGDNKIYDLSYFMNEDNFSPATITKWNLWKANLQANQKAFYNLTIENALLHMEEETAKAALTKLQGDLKLQENLLAVEVEAAAQGMTGGNMVALNNAVAGVKNQISQQEAVIADLAKNMEANQQQLMSIKQATHFKTWTYTDADGNSVGFTAEELSQIDLYIKEDSIEDSTFVVPTVDSYTNTADTAKERYSLVEFSGVTIETTEIELEGSATKYIDSITGGHVDVMALYETVYPDGASFAEMKSLLSGGIIRGTIERSEDKVTMSLYLEAGCVTVVGSDYTFDKTTLKCGVADVYATDMLSAYSQHAVAWDLYEYGQEILHRVSQPSYSFSVDSGNFLAISDFDAFREKLKLGDCLYLNVGTDLGNDKIVYQPVLVGANIDFESRNLQLEFSESFRLTDSAFKLADLLEKSVSAGSAFDLGKYNYNSFMNSGGTNGVQETIKNNLDLAVNSIMSSSDQSITIDETGIRLRKWNEDGTAYLNNQIWMTENGIVFTKDGWNSAYMAIGTFTDPTNPELGSLSGIVAPSIVGTLLAGEELIIQSSKEYGGTAEFRVSADGAKLYNSQFDLVKGLIDDKTGAYTKKYGQISLNPSIGIIAGSISEENEFYGYNNAGEIVGVKTADGSVLTSAKSINTDNLPLANFWVDLEGNAYFKGNVHATDGVFNGVVYATDGEFKGIVQASDFRTDKDGSIVSMLKDGRFKSDYLDLKGITVKDSEGNVTFEVNGETGAVTIGSGGSVSWDSVNGADDVATQDDIKDFTSIDDVKDYLSTEEYKTGVVSIVNGTVNADVVNSWKISADWLDGEVITISNGYMTDALGNPVLQDGEKVPLTYAYMYVGKNVEGVKAFEIQGINGLRLVSGGNIFLSSSGADITLGSHCSIQGGPLVMPSQSIGTNEERLSLSNCIDGQVFFVI